MSKIRELLRRTWEREEDHVVSGSQESHQPLLTQQRSQAAVHDQALRGHNGGHYGDRGEVRQRPWSVIIELSSCRQTSLLWILTTGFVASHEVWKTLGPADDGGGKQL